jgi:hypothetical protein
MSRPYQRCGMPELESLLLVGVHKEQLEVLSELQEELKYRTSQRALDLRDKVEAALARLAPGQFPPPAQPGLDFALPPGLPAPAGEGKRGEPTVPRMAIADAAKVLGVGATAAWEAVEKARHQLVASAVASGDSTALAAAKRANLAYGSLAAHRKF